MAEIVKDEGQIGKAGKFTVVIHGDGSNTIDGPKAYLAQYNPDKILDSVRLYMRYNDAPVAGLVAVALQTDYAAWCGMQLTEAGL